DAGGAGLPLVPAEPRLVPARRREVLAQVVGGVLEAAQEPPVLREPFQPLRRDLAEQPDRVVADGLPQGGVHGAEQVERLVVPGPAQVEDELLKLPQRLGKDGADRETSDCLHTTPRYALYTDGATVTEGGPGEPTDSMNAFELRNAPARGGFRALRDPSGRASRSGHAGSSGRGAKLSETTGR